MFKAATLFAASVAVVQAGDCTWKADKCAVAATVPAGCTDLTDAAAVAKAKEGREAGQAATAVCEGGSKDDTAPSGATTECNGDGCITLSYIGRPVCQAQLAIDDWCGQQGCGEYYAKAGYLGARTCNMTSEVACNAAVYDATELDQSIQSNKMQFAMFEDHCPSNSASATAASALVVLAPALGFLMY